VFFQSDGLLQAVPCSLQVTVHLPQQRGGQGVEFAAKTAPAVGEWVREVGTAAGRTNGWDLPLTGDSALSPD
jgi:hypothetical protein